MSRPVEYDVNTVGVRQYTPVVDAHGGTTDLRESTAVYAYNPHDNTGQNGPFLWLTVARNPQSVQDPRSASAAFNHLTYTGAQTLRDQLTHWLETHENPHD